MEEEIRQQHQDHHSPLSALTTTITKTTATTTLSTSDKDSRSSSHLLPEKSGGDTSSSSSSMGGNRSGSTSSSVGWMGEGGEGSSSSSNTTSTTKTPTTPRQPSNRDSGYHTDFSFSPATFSSQPHFTFDPPFPDTAGDSAPAGSSEGSLPQGSSSLELGSPMGSTPPPLPPRSTLAVGPGWQPRRVLPDVDSDDEGDDDAFVSDNVTIAATSHLPGLHARPSRDAHQSPRRALMATERRQSSHDETDGPGDDNARRAESRLRGGAEEEAGRRTYRNCSPRSVAFRGVRNIDVADEICDDEEEEGEEERVSCTDYHHAPFSLVTLPGGERIRPLLARTIATQTPHLHCQLIDQILDCPQDFPQIARGSAVRRLRYYSEGEESVGVSSLSRGPLPDLVPVTQGHRERSLSAPDLESLQRQRMAAREVGRELRRISDEFVRNHEELRDLQHPHGALAALHAELNGVAAFFLTGVRRFLYRGFAGYFRHVFHWTRQAMAASRTQQPRPRRDSSVDQPR